MRWAKKPKPLKPIIGSFKSKIVFLLFPRTLYSSSCMYQQTRWLEISTIVYRYEDHYDRNDSWEPIRWMD